MPMVGASDCPRLVRYRNRTFQPLPTLAPQLARRNRLVDKAEAFDALVRGAEQRVRDAALTSDPDTRNRLLAEVSELAARADALTKGAPLRTGSTSRLSGGPSSSWFSQGSWSCDFGRGSASGYVRSPNRSRIGSRQYAAEQRATARRSEPESVRPICAPL